MMMAMTTAVMITIMHFGLDVCHVYLHTFSGGSTFGCRFVGRRPQMPRALLFYTSRARACHIYAGGRRKTANEVMAKKKIYRSRATTKKVANLRLDDYFV